MVFSNQIQEAYINRYITCVFCMLFALHPNYGRDAVEVFALDDFFKVGILTMLCLDIPFSSVG